MRKITKKLLSILLAIIMVMTVSTTAYAQSTDEVTLDGVKYMVRTSASGVTTVIDNDTGATASYNEHTGKLIIKENQNSKEIIINIDGLIEQSNVAARSANSSSDNEYAYDNYTKYYNSKPYTFWEIQIPDEIKFTYETNNATNLYNFQNNVDTMREKQDSIGWSWGATGLAVILGIIAVTPVGAIAAGILAVAGVLVGSSSIPDLISQSETIKNAQISCVTYFNRVVPVSKP